MGREPIYMQVSGGHLLNPVRKLGSTYIFLFLTEKEKCRSIPVAVYRQIDDRCRYIDANRFRCRHDGKSIPVPAWQPIDDRCRDFWEAIGNSGAVLCLSRFYAIIKQEYYMEGNLL